MKCPFCAVEIHPARKPHQLHAGGPDKGHVFVTGIHCPACDQVSLYREYIEPINRPEHPGAVKESFLIWPKISSRAPAPSEVPAEYAEDYVEAALVLGDSPKASAALSRRVM